MSIPETEKSRILVSAGSKHGSTEEIAARIGSVLHDRGHDVDVLAPEQVTKPEDYDAIILGSAVYGGHWVESARVLAHRVSELGSPVPTWLFSSGPVGDPPKPEEDPVDIADILTETSAGEHRVFSGKIDKSTLSFGEKAIVIAVRAAVGDFRDWDEISAWAQQIADRLIKEESAQ